MTLNEVIKETDKRYKDACVSKDVNYYFELLMLLKALKTKQK